MDLISKKIRKYAPSGYHTLQKVRKIDDTDMGANRKWAALKAGYESVESNPNADWVHYLLQSLLNSILYSERVYFILSRDTFRREVLKKDGNWNKVQGFKNEKWTVFTDYLENEGILKHYNKNSGATKVWEVIDVEILSYLEVNRDQQLKETLEYANNNKDLEDDLDGDRKGDDEGDQEVSNKKLEVRKAVVEKVSFKQLLVIQHPDSFPSFDELDHLAQLATENCDDFDGESMDVNTFKRHLESISGKMSPAKKKFKDSLVAAFEPIAVKYGTLKETEHIKLKEPTEIKSRAIKKAVDDSDQIQNNTLSILKATFGKEKITILKRRLTKCDDPEEQADIQGELHYWENMNG